MTDIELFIAKAEKDLRLNKIASIWRGEVNARTDLVEVLRKDKDASWNYFRKSDGKSVKGPV